MESLGPVLRALEAWREGEAKALLSARPLAGPEEAAEALALRGFLLGRRGDLLGYQRLALEAARMAPTPFTLYHLGLALPPGEGALALEEAFHRLGGDPEGEARLHLALARARELMGQEAALAHAALAQARWPSPWTHLHRLSLELLFGEMPLEEVLAGAAYARSPALPPLLGGSLLFLSAFLYRRLPPAPPPRPGGPFRLREAFAGLGFLWSHPLLRRVFLIARVHGLVHGAAFALLPLYTLRGLEAPAWVYGLLSGAWGLGAAAGALLLEKLLPLGRGNLARVSLLLLGAPLLGLALLPPWPLAAGLLFPFGLGQQFWSLLVTSLLYRELPEELVGRGMGGVGFVSSLLAPLGPLLGGVLAGLALPLPFLLVGALLLGLVPLAGRGWR